MAKYVYHGPEGPFTPGETYDLAHAPANTDDWRATDAPPVPEPTVPAEPSTEETP